MSIACARMRRAVYALHWTCGVKPTPRGVNNPSKSYIMRVQDENNPVSLLQSLFYQAFRRQELAAGRGTQPARAHGLPDADVVVPRDAPCACSGLP